MDRNIRSLNFEKYFPSLCKKAGKKLSVLARLSNFMSLTQRRVLQKIFIESQLEHCLFVWMFHGRTKNRKINHLQEASLRIVDKDYTSSFEDLLRKEKSATVHHRNIQSLTVELTTQNPQFPADLVIFTT